MEAKNTQEARNTPRFIDLHSHTNYSDGVGMTPKHLVQIKAYDGIDIMAKTDHDNLRGYEEAKQEADRLGITLLPGVEITTDKYHLLGINFNPDDKEFNEFIEYSRALQGDGCATRVKMVQETGVPITIEKVRKEFPESRLGKFNVAVAMQRDPECKEYLKQLHPGKTTFDIFSHYFREGGIAAGLERPSVSDEETIRAVHKAGGLVGLAHPPKDIDDMAELDRLVKLGIDFIEIQPLFKDKYPYHIFEQYAKEHGIPISYGSDYHGPTMDRKSLGRGENILSPELEAVLNKGYVKISNSHPQLEECLV